MAQGYDRREAILCRIAELLGGVFTDDTYGAGNWVSGGLTVPILGDTTVPNTVTSIPAANFSRDRNQLQKFDVPAILLLDGDETRDMSKPRAQRGLVENGIPSQIMKMTPEIYVVLDTRTILNVNAGKDLNTARLAILATLFPDRTLQKIIGPEGDINYDGSITDFSRNRTMKGQLGISITFTYPLIGGEVMGLIG
jgi:hypothetical protein